MQLVELEIGLSRLGKDDYRVELRLDRADQDVLLPSVVGKARFDFEQLRQQQAAPEDYGRQLRANLVADEPVKDGCRRTCDIARALDAHLRLKVRVTFKKGDRTTAAKVEVRERD